MGIWALNDSIPLLVVGSSFSFLKIENNVKKILVVGRKNK